MGLPNNGFPPPQSMPLRAVNTASGTRPRFNGPYWPKAYSHRYDFEPKTGVDDCRSVGRPDPDRRVRRVAKPRVDDLGPARTIARADRRGEPRRWSLLHARATACAVRGR